MTTEIQVPLTADFIATVQREAVQAERVAFVVMPTSAKINVNYAYGMAVNIGYGQSPQEIIETCRKSGSCALYGSHTIYAYRPAVDGFVACLEFDYGKVQLRQEIMA